MAQTDFSQAQRVSTPEAAAKRMAAQEAKERAAAEREATAGAVTQGLLSEALTSGFAVHDSTKEALTPEPEAPETPQEPASAPAGDAVDKIIAGLESNATDVSDAWAEEEDEEQEVQMPDFEAEAEREILDREIASAETEYEPEESEEWEESNPADLKRAIIAEKKAKYYENLTAQRERSKWEKEALKHFPFSKHALPSIAAKSRRGYLAEAKAAHEAVKPYIKSATEARLAELEEERARIKGEEQAKAQAAWGKATVGPDSPPETSEWKVAEEKAREKKDLAGIIAAQMFGSREGGEKVG